MKMFKRFAAALLVGVMALAMLTACGERTSKIGKEFEDKYVAALNTLRGEGAEALKNDEALREKALGQLSYVKGDGTIAKENVTVTTVLEKDKSDNPVKIQYVMVLSKNDDGVYKATEVTAEALEKINSTMSGSNAQNAQKVAKAIQKFGVATKVVNGKTYAAVAMEVDASALKS